MTLVGDYKDYMERYRGQSGSKAVFLYAASTQRAGAVASGLSAATGRVKGGVDEKGEWVATTEDSMLSSEDKH